ncbi:MAG: hypothetical protein ACFCVC_18145 [Acidimicrobiia bacterium]
MIRNTWYAAGFSAEFAIGDVTGHTWLELRLEVAVGHVGNRRLL